jgi:hypothetical protein
MNLVCHGIDLLLDELAVWEFRGFATSHALANGLIQ